VPHDSRGRTATICLRRGSFLASSPGSILASSEEQALEAIVERVVRRVVREELAADRAGVLGSNMITMREFGRRHSISENTVRNMIRDGRLAAVKIGAAVRIRADAEIGKRAGPAISHAMTVERILQRKP
jgi:excisionase family DNA binding protein